MEDWAYAGSWENEVNKIKPIKICTPSTFGGYAKEKTIYGSNTAKTMSFLVDNAIDKKPNETLLGSDYNLFHSGK
jgi:hypothetical protein